MRYHYGFTLLEMIVALGVFSIVILTTSSGFLSLLNAERKAAAKIEIEDNLRFALEVMAKEIRTGRNYTDPGIQPISDFSFVNANNEMITYRLSAQERIIKVIAREEAATEILPLSSEHIKVENLGFWVRGAGVGGADGQPMVTITITAKTLGQKITSEFNLQTTVSQRQRDL